MSGRTVWLLGYPVALGLSLGEHVDDVVREFKLMALSQEAGTTEHEVPARLQAMVAHLSSRYAAELSEPDRLRADAAARGDATVDLPYPVRPETEQAVLGWRQMLADVDEYCRAADLLTLQRSPEQATLTGWVCDEFLRQLRGEPPRPWPGTP